jgi:hypothetical protein
MRFKKTIIAWFILFGVLTVANQSQTVLVIATIISLGALGILLIASPTVLFYSTAAVLPALAIDRRRGGWRIAAIIMVVLAAGLVPGILSRMQADAFGRTMSRDDVVNPALGRPKTIELIGDDWSSLFDLSAGDRSVPCTDICRKLLFNREVDRVRMTRVATRSNFYKGGPTVSVTYHIEKRDSCPELFREGTDIGKAVRLHLVAGNCLIADADAGQPLDAAVSLILLYKLDSFPVPKHLAPQVTSIHMARRLSMEQRKPAGGTARLVQRTETQTRNISLPLYFSYTFSTAIGGYNGAYLFHDTYAINPIDLTQALRDAFGFKIAPIEPPPSEDATKIAERVLSLPSEAAPALSAQQQDVLNDALAPLRKQAELSDAEVDFISRVIRDERVNQGKLGQTLQEVFGNHQTRLIALVPLLVQRLKFKVNQSIGHYQAGLGYTLMRLPAEAVQPHRDAIIDILEAQPDWYTAGLLSHIADLEGDPTDLIARRLEARSDSTRQAAGIAACRSSRAIWEKLRPFAVAHLEADVARSKGFRDESHKLLAALVRFGERETAARLIDASTPSDKMQYTRKIAQLDQDFPAQKCLYFD